MVNLIKEKEIVSFKSKIKRELIKTPIISSITICEGSFLLNIFSASLAMKKEK